jgi:hypothetical protein
MLLIDRVHAVGPEVSSLYSGSFFACFREPGPLVSSRKQPSNRMQLLHTLLLEKMAQPTAATRTLLKMPDRHFKVFGEQAVCDQLFECLGCQVHPVEKARFQHQSPHSQSDHIVAGSGE